MRWFTADVFGFAGSSEPSMIGYTITVTLNPTYAEMLEAHLLLVLHSSMAQTSMAQTLVRSMLVPAMVQFLPSNERVSEKSLFR